MKFLDKRTDIEPKEYTHQFYGWKFYDYGNNLNENKINNIINKLKEFSLRLQYFKMFYLYMIRSLKMLIIILY